MIKFIILFAVFFSTVSLAETAPFSLDKGEALVVLQIVDIRGMSVDSLVFNNIDSKQKIVIKCRQVVSIKPLDKGCVRSVPVKIAAGRYYLRSIVSFRGSGAHIDTSAKPLLAKRPDDLAKTIEIRPGAVTYLGDWSFHKRSGRELGRDIGFQISEETLLGVVSEHPELKLLPLYYANQSGKVKTVIWP